MTFTYMKSLEIISVMQLTSLVCHRLELSIPLKPSTTSFLNRMPKMSPPELTSEHEPSFSHPNKFTKSSREQLQIKKPLALEEVIELRDKFRDLNSDYFILLGQHESDATKLQAFADNGYQNAGDFFRIEEQSDQLIRLITKRLNELPLEIRKNPSSQTVDEHLRFEQISLAFEEKLSKLTGLRQQFEGPNFAGYNLEINYRLIGNTVLLPAQGRNRGRGASREVQRSYSEPLNSASGVQSPLTESKVFFPGIEKQQPKSLRTPAMTAPVFTKPTLSLNTKAKHRTQSSSDLSSPPLSAGSSELSLPLLSLYEHATSPALADSNADTSSTQKAISSRRVLKAAGPKRRKRLTGFDSSSDGEDGEFKLGRGARKQPSSPPLDLDGFPVERRRSARVISVKTAPAQIAKPLTKLKIRKVKREDSEDSQSNQSLQKPTPTMAKQSQPPKVVKEEQSFTGQLSLPAQHFSAYSLSSHMIEVLESAVKDGFEKVLKKCRKNPDVLIEISRLRELCDNRIHQFESQLLQNDDRIVDLQGRLDTALTKLRAPDKTAQLRVIRLEDKLKENDKLLNGYQHRSAEYSEEVVQLEEQAEELEKQVAQLEKRVVQLENSLDNSKSAHEQLLGVNSLWKSKVDDLKRKLAAKADDPARDNEEEAKLREKRVWASDSETEDEEERPVKRRCD